MLIFFLRPRLSSVSTPHYPDYVPRTSGEGSWDKFALKKKARKIIRRVTTTKKVDPKIGRQIAKMLEEEHTQAILVAEIEALARNWTEQQKILKSLIAAVKKEEARALLSNYLAFLKEQKKRQDKINSLVSAVSFAMFVQKYKQDEQDEMLILLLM